MLPFDIDIWTMTKASLSAVKLFDDGEFLEAMYFEGSISAVVPLIKTRWSELKHVSLKSKHGENS